MRRAIESATRHLALALWWGRGAAEEEQRGKRVAFVFRRRAANVTVRAIRSVIFRFLSLRLLSRDTTDRPAAGKGESCLRNGFIYYIG
jgi:hypothetical protein